MTTVDVIVIGLGPGGEYAANKATSAGLQVVGVESRLVGGECPYFGCIPSKMMVRAAGALGEARRVGQLAGDVTATPSWAPVAARIRDEATDDWDDTVAVQRLQDAGVTVVRGHGRLSGPGQVTVGDQTFRARRGVVLNPGTAPAVPPIPGLAETPYWTNRDIVQVTELPGSLVVIGGGAIGLELAQVFARFGVQVSVLEVADRILAVEEPESSALLAKVFAADGIRVMAETTIESVTYADGRFTIAGPGITADKVLVAAGRRNNLADLGLETVGLDPQARTLETDGRMRVRADEGSRIWAVGDVVGKGAFTHLSIYQAGIVVRDILGEEGEEADYRATPRVTFTDPEVGSVGLTEQQARDQGLDIRTGSAELPASSRGWLHKVGNEGMIKLVADGDLLVGATSIGPSGGEVLSMLTTAVHGRVPVPTLRSMIYAYPTFHRAVEAALDDLG